MQPVKGPVHAPDFGLQWINSPGLTMHELRGSVVLVDFWDYTCVNCIRTLPYVKEWHARYKDKGLVVLGVHAPEFTFARTKDHVAGAAREFGLQYPIVLDNEYQIWQAFANRCWPAKYLVDHKGYVRYFHFGEGDYENSERDIQQLLRERDAGVVLPEPMAPLRDTDAPGAVCYRVTPELYLGYRRGRVGNDGGLKDDETLVYTAPQWMQPDVPYLDGPWTSKREYLEVPGTAESTLTLNYTAMEVNVVMSGAGRISVSQDGIALDDLQVDTPRMYQLVRNAKFGSHTLELKSTSAGVALYAFTFVSCVERP